MASSQEQSTPKRVWYASYGSNLKRHRFMCYIKGGIPEGRTIGNEGCRDKTEPLESRPLSLNFDLYFAGRSSVWYHEGVAFIREGRQNALTLGRMHLISDEQFNDVVMQENSRRVDGSRFVPDFEQLVGRRHTSLGDDLWYGRLLNIGSEGGYPILTFTTARTDLQHPIAPSEQYVKVIASGIKETYPNMSDDEIVEYLSRTDGIRGQIDLPRIRGWVAAA